MIIPSMSYKEMYDHLAEDLTKVKYKREYYLPKAIKELGKAKQFPAWKWYTYKIPSTNNSYVIYYYAENRGCIESPQIGSFVDVFFDNQRYVVKWGAIPFRLSPKTPIALVRELKFYTSHFLHRYNERFLKDDSLTANDIACQYLSRNNKQMQLIINESINKNIEKYGEGSKLGFRVRDGVCFTKSEVEGYFGDGPFTEDDRVEVIIETYTTFVSESMLTDFQLDAVMKEEINQWKRTINDFMEEASDGKLKLRLET